MDNCRGNRDKLVDLVNMCKKNLFLSNSGCSKSFENAASLRDYAFARVMNRNDSFLEAEDEADRLGQRCVNVVNKIPAQQQHLAENAIDQILNLAQENKLSNNSLCVKVTDQKEAENEVSEEFINSVRDCMHMFNIGKMYLPLSQNNKKQGKREHICEICQKQFSSAADLRRHSNIHAVERPFSCDHCNSKFSDKGNLSDHLRRHLGIKPHLCTYCGKTFTNTTQLKVHTRVHTKEKPYSCSFCNKSFSTNGHCRNHMRTHLESFEFCCSVCGKGFNKKDNMLTHEKSHDAHQFTFECEICERKFRQQQTLKQHLKLHSGVKQYKCKYCGKLFAQPPSYYVHSKKCKLKNELQEN